MVSLSAVWIADVEIPSELVADRREGRRAKTLSANS